MRISKKVCYNTSFKLALTRVLTLFVFPFTFMSFCRRPGGLGPFTPNGSFDLTVCFEDAVASALYSIFLVLALIRLYTLFGCHKFNRGKKSLTLLWIKEVLCSFYFSMFNT